MRQTLQRNAGIHPWTGRGLGGATLVGVPAATKQEATSSLSSAHINGRLVIGPTHPEITALKPQA